MKVSFLHNPTGLTASKELKVVAGAQLAGVTFQDVQLPSGKTLLTEDLKNVKIPYTAVDQYGNAVELSASDTGNIVVVSSDESIVDPDDVSFIKEGTPEVTKVQIDTFGGYGKVTLSFVNKVTGDVYRLPLEVNQKAGVISKVTLEKTALDIAQGGDDVAVGLTVTDKYGNAIKPADYVAGTAFTISTSNSSVATAEINNDPASDNYGKLMVKLADGATKGKKATITVTVNSTGETARLEVTVGEAAVPSSIEFYKDSKHVTSLAKGATTTVKYVVKDQYGNEITTQNDDYKVVFEVKNSAEAITIPAESAESKETVASIDVTAAKAGSATLVAKLVKDADEVIATKELTFNVVDNSSDKLTYAISDIGTIYKAGAGADDDTTPEADESTTIEQADIDAGYAKEIKLTATDVSGNKVAIPSNQIISVDVDKDDVAVVQEVDGKWYIAGKNADLDEDTNVTVSVVYNAEDGVKTLTQDVTVSKDDLKVVSVKFKDKPVGATDAKDVTSLTVTDSAELKSGFDKAFVWAQDQFGGTKAVNEEDVKFTIVAVDGISNVADDTVTVDLDQGTITIKDTQNDTAVTKDGAKFRLVAIKDGVSDYITVTVANKDSEPEANNSENIETTDNEQGDTSDQTNE